MPSLFDKISKEMTVAGLRPRSQEARSWLGNKISQMRIASNRSNILNDASRVVSRAFIGRMYFFHYDPKMKETLPVWDKFPLVIPMEYYSDGFLAMNLHYLDPYTRLLLLDRLQDFVNNDKYDDTTRLNLSYKLLSQSRRYNMVQQCIKRYLFSHIRSSLIYIEPDQWETAIFLPTEKMVYKQ